MYELMLVSLRHVASDFGNVLQIWQHTDLLLSNMGLCVRRGKVMGPWFPLSKLGYQIANSRSERKGLPFCAIHQTFCLSNRQWDPERIGQDESSFLVMISSAKVSLLLFKSMTQAKHTNTFAILDVTVMFVLQIQHTLPRRHFLQACVLTATFFESLGTAEAGEVSGRCSKN